MWDSKDTPAVCMRTGTLSLQSYICQVLRYAVIFSMGYERLACTYYICFFPRSSECHYSCVRNGLNEIAHGIKRRVAGLHPVG